MDEKKAKILLIVAIIYFIIPDAFPGPIDDVIFLIFAAMNKSKAKRING